MEGWQSPQKYKPSAEHFADVDALGEINFRLVQLRYDFF